MKNFLVTGFNAFGGESVNPSAKLIEFLEKDLRWGTCCDVLTLPVSFSACDGIVKAAISKKRYDYIIMLGQAGGGSEVLLERIALNWIESSQVDNSGLALSGQKINPAADNAFFSSLPLDLINEKLLKSGIPSKISLSAGGFVCNYLFYQIANYLQDSQSKCGFVHLPYLPEQVEDKASKNAMSFLMQYRAIQKILETLEELSN